VNVGAYYLAVTGPKFFNFPTFRMDTTNYRGKHVENVKKAKNQPTLLYSAPPSLYIKQKFYKSTKFNLRDGRNFFYLSILNVRFGARTASLYGQVALKLYDSGSSTLILIE
jgi:hypothetical protein